MARSLCGALGALAALALAAPGAAGQAPLRLSFAEAVRRAAAAAPRVELAGLRTAEADARVREARAALLPAVSLGGLWLNRTFNSQSLGISFPGFPVLVGPFNNYDARASAAQTLFDWSSVARVRAARTEASGSRAEEGVSAEVAAQAAALVAAREADSALAAELVELAEAQRAAGVSAAIDVTRARAQLVTAEGLLLVARSEADRARIEVARALGLEVETPLELADTLSPALGAAAVAAARDSALATGLAQRPELGAERARAAAARQAGSAIRAERLPRLVALGDYGLNGRTVPAAIATRQIALQVSVPLLDGFRREARLAEQDAAVREAEVRERDLQQQIAADVDTALLELRAAQARQAIAAEQLRLAEEELAEARERFRAGVAGNIEVITAQANLIRARDTDIDARFAAALARVALARAAGVARTLH